MRLIDGSALLKEMRKAQKECEKDGEESGGESVLIAAGLDDACDMVKAAPTIDAVKHGKWVSVIVKAKKECIFDKFDRYQPVTCSICKEPSPVNSNYSYCPHCGAKMDLEA